MTWTLDVVLKNFDLKLYWSMVISHIRLLLAQSSVISQNGQSYSPKALPLGFLIHCPSDFNTGFVFVLATIEIKKKLYFS